MDDFIIIRRLRRLHRFGENKSTMFKAARSEIEQQACFVSGGFEVIDYLRLFGFAHAGQGLQLNDYRVKANKVSAITSCQQLSFVVD